MGMGHGVCSNLASSGEPPALTTGYDADCNIVLLLPILSVCLMAVLCLNEPTHRRTFLTTS